jgi:DNA repair protein RadC
MIKSVINFGNLGFSSGGRKQVIILFVLTVQGLLYQHIKPFLADLPYECFYIILLDASNKVVKTVCVSEGGISGTMIDPKRIFKIALDSYCSGIIISHNHPSGNLNPSEGDTKLTKKIIGGGKLLDITVIDHLIIGMDGYFSFADEGLME